MPDRAAFSGPLHFLPSLVYLRSLEKCRLVRFCNRFVVAQSVGDAPPGQAARREADAAVLDRTLKGPTKRNTALVDMSGAGADYR